MTFVSIFLIEAEQNLTNFFVAFFFFCSFIDRFQDQKMTTKENRKNAISSIKVIIEQFKMIVFDLEERLKVFFFSIKSRFIFGNIDK